jgi:hypothetical protein
VEKAGGLSVFTQNFGGGVELRFSSVNDGCLAFPLNDVQAQAEPCQGSTGVLFTATQINGHWHFRNNHWSTVTGENRFLAGQGCVSCQFQTEPSGLGYLEAFDFN